MTTLPLMSMASSSGTASDVTSGRRDDLREAAEQIATAEGAGLEHATIVNDRPVDVVAREIMTFLGWPSRRRDA